MSPTRPGARKLAVIVGMVSLAAACGSSAHGRAAPAAAPTTHPVVTTPAPTTAPTTAAATTTTVDPGVLPQTPTQPAEDAPFQQRMAVLWQAIVTDQPTNAAAAFFPESAYAQLKALSDNAADWTNRLAAHYALDIGAAHELLGDQASTAQLVTVNVGSARWVSPGGCDNRIGYWFTPGARVVYQVGGTTHSFGIAALDSWRGEWYVIHLGSESPPSSEGVVDSPSAGTGYPGSGGGC